MLGGATVATVVEPTKSFFFFDSISMPSNSLRPAALSPEEWSVGVLSDLERCLNLFPKAGAPLSPNDVAALCGLSKMHNPRRGPTRMESGFSYKVVGEGRGGGKTTYMLLEAVAFASEGRRVAISGRDLHYTHRLVTEAKQMAKRCGVDPSKIGGAPMPMPGTARDPLLRSRVDKLLVDHHHFDGRRA